MQSAIDKLKFAIEKIDNIDKHGHKGYLAVELINAADYLESVIQELENPWLPIEGAPKDGTRILGYVPQAHWDSSLKPCLVQIHWDHRYEMWTYESALNDDYNGFSDWQPTKWQPLPQLPREGDL